MFRNLIFDWSGTLVDDLGPVLDATNAVFAAHGRPAMTLDEFRREFRLPYLDFYEQFLPGVPIAGLEEIFRAAFAASSAPVTVLPHARDKLEWCRRRGIRAFVLTSMDAVAFRRQLEEFALGPAFEATYAGVLDKREMIRELLDRHRLDPLETAFVGDMTHDVDTARHGGVTSVAVLTGYTSAGMLAGARPDLTVPDLQVLRVLLDPADAADDPPPTGVAALVHDGAGRLLLAGDPGGGGERGMLAGELRRGESPLQALRRVIRERTGLEVDQIRFVGAVDSPDPAGRHLLRIHYLGLARDGGIPPGGPAGDLAWVPAETVARLPLDASTRLVLDACRDGGMIPAG